jgi:hypothetical protein
LICCWASWGMARKLRVRCPGAIFPEMNRGDRKEAIFEYGSGGDGRSKTWQWQTVPHAHPTARSLIRSPAANWPVEGIGSLARAASSTGGREKARESKFLSVFPDGGRQIPLPDTNLSSRAAKGKL